MGWRSGEADKTEWRRERKSPMEGLPSGERNSSAWGSFRRGHGMCGSFWGQCKQGMMRKSPVNDSNPHLAPDDERVA